MPFLQCLLVSLLLLCSLHSHATIVYSSNGYAVHLNVAMIELVPNTMSCPWGYNYNVRLQYTITFSGPNAPGSMYTLQGTVRCGESHLFYDLPNGPSSGTVLTNGNAWRGISDCTTANPITVGCAQVFVQIEGPGIPYQVVEVIGNPMPVEFAGFSAVPHQDLVQVEWTTASERDNAFFTVERSADALTFESLSTVEAAGHSDILLHYAITDHSPLPGTSFYRVAQTDLDGTTTYSPLAAIERRRKGADIHVSPNPGNGERIMVPDDVDQFRLEIIGPTGKLIAEIARVSREQVLPYLVEGTYLLRFTDPATGNAHFTRYVKL